MNTTINTRIKKTCRASLISLKKAPLIKSIVNVELDAITSDDKVDIDADKTKITTKAIIPSESPDNIVGTIESTESA